MRRKLKVSARKNGDKFEISYQMDDTQLQERLKLIDNKINGIKRSIDLYNDQLENLSTEKEQIELLLKD